MEEKEKCSKIRKEFYVRKLYFSEKNPNPDQGYVCYRSIHEALGGEL